MTETAKALIILWNKNILQKIAIYRAVNKNNTGKSLGFRVKTVLG
jgi:hypothetical protein